MKGQEMKGMIFNVQRMCVGDGPGVRTTVFMKGCPLRCLWCHNPEGFSEKKQLMRNKIKCIGCGRCRNISSPENFCDDVCFTEALILSGKEYTPDELINELRKDFAYFENGDGGVTFSGGEPMSQAEFVAECCRMLKKEGIHTAVDTSGYAEITDFAKVIPYCDLFLYDIKCIDSALHKRLTGKENIKILENLKQLSKEHVWIRIPLIRGYNDADEDICRLNDFLKTIPWVEKTEINPFHIFGCEKYKMLGTEYKMREVSPYLPEELSLMKERILLGL